MRRNGPGRPVPSNRSSRGTPHRGATPLRPTRVGGKRSGAVDRPTRLHSFREPIPRDPRRTHVRSTGSLLDRGAGSEVGIGGELVNHPNARSTPARETERTRRTPDRGDRGSVGREDPAGRAPTGRSHSEDLTPTLVGPLRSSESPSDTRGVPSSVRFPGSRSKLRRGRIIGAGATNCQRRRGAGGPRAGCGGSGAGSARGRPPGTRARTSAESARATPPPPPSSSPPNLRSDRRLWGPEGGCPVDFETPGPMIRGFRRRHRIGCSGTTVARRTHRSSTTGPPGRERSVRRSRSPPIPRDLNRS